jgi:hypothetical protein
MCRTHTRVFVIHYTAPASLSHTYTHTHTHKHRSSVDSKMLRYILARMDALVAYVAPFKR